MELRRNFGADLTAKGVNTRMSSSKGTVVDTIHCHGEDVPSDDGASGMAVNQTQAPVALHAFKGKDVGSSAVFLPHCALQPPLDGVHPIPGIQPIPGTRVISVETLRMAA
jgi:hypothetical protein